MKKSILSLMMLGLLLTNCSNQELAMTTEDEIKLTDGTSSENNYISISIVTAGNAGTRTEGQGYEKGDDEMYRDGLKEESQINKVLLLFFDKEGHPAKVAKKDATNEYINYIMLTDFAGSYDDDHKYTEEKVITDQVLSLTVPREDNNPVLPAQLIAVVNPPEDYSELVGKSLGSGQSENPEELRGMYDDFEDIEKYSNGFVMTNSVFDDNQIVDTTPLDKSHFYTEKEEAANDPVIIYVERVLARVDFNLSEAMHEAQIGTVTRGDKEFPYFKTGKNVSDNTDEDNEVYVCLLGWNVFDTPDKSRLIKRIDPSSWGTDLFGKVNSPWNARDYHRSFWALNPPKERINYKTGPFNYNIGTIGSEATDNTLTDSNNKYNATKNEIPEKGKYTKAYFQENAAPIEYPKQGTARPSKLIIGAQLVDKYGNPREIAKWAGQHYTSDGLKAELCNTNLKSLWYLAETPSNNNGNTRYIYKQINPDQLEYKQLTNESGETSNYASLVLNDNGIYTDATHTTKRQWYIGTSANDLQAINDYTTEDNKKIESVDQYIENNIGKNNIMLWKSGYTYFYLTIEHLGAEETPAYYGVVRNHIYDIYIASISGLGTPVFNPEKDIKVEPPTEDTGVMKAEIRVLSWRVVRHDYNLTW